MVRSGSQIRKEFIDFFVERGHTVVPSSSLVPGGDQTLLFTNAGMVQFKDVFLGTDHRSYTRAVDSQKCMRVAGKHNDLDDVGRDDSHHTFFEMLGNWSFGDYHKKEAITWAWELLTEVWGLDKSKLWTTYFKDDKGDIPTDEEAAAIWKQQPGIDPEHVLAFGRKENFWEMADTGPCGPCSEIHIDRGAEFCDKKNVPGHVCSVNGDCKRFMELWNLVFIQYNRLSATKMEPLPAAHVDTGMGFERIVSVLQGVTSNYKTDLLFPLIKIVQQLSGHTDEEREHDMTPYRVVADHVRAATFLIADGVVPGNVGRNYVCRMIIRRAARFAGKLGLNEPFMAKVAEQVIETYGEAYPEVLKNKKTILDNLTREEKRFQRTVDTGMAQLEGLLTEVKASGQKVLDGHKAFDLYATHGLPFELTRDVAREEGLDVDDAGFQAAMEEHRQNSGAGKAFGPLGGEDADVFRSIFEELQAKKELTSDGVVYDPYSTLEVDGKLLAIVKDEVAEESAAVGDEVEVILPKTCFYVESGGQVSDMGIISSEKGWEIKVEGMRKPASGIIAHVGTVIKGSPHVGDAVVARVDADRRKDIMRNHTATHLLHAQLHQVLGEHARQAGSLVAPDRLRFDFTHPEAMTQEQLERVEAGVNQAILANYSLKKVSKPLDEAIAEGAMALFGEKYGAVVRTVTIGDEHPVSYELCGGTHLDETGDIGLFLITSEGSAAAGVRRIEAVTGRAAYELVQRRFRELKNSAALLECSVDDVTGKIDDLNSELEQNRKLIAKLRQEMAGAQFGKYLDNVPEVKGVPVSAAAVPEADADALRQLTDQFRQKYPSGVVVLGSVSNDKPFLVAVVTDDLIKRGLNAGDLVRTVAKWIGGSGGGRPNLAQAGGKDAGGMEKALAAVNEYVQEKLK
jgi:alanyl-tRNA synthetase